MRKRYLVTYDIGDAKRLRRVFKALKGFGVHLQLSVFACDLNEMNFVRMKARVNAEIDSSEDAVLIVDVGPADGRGATSFECLGRATRPPDREPRIF